MRFKSAIRSYVRAYASHVILNILCNILFALSSALIIALIAPFLELLFSNGATKSMPSKGVTLSFVQERIQYYINYWVAHIGPLKSLLIMTIIIFILSVIKNIFRYLAMFFIAPLRNGIVKDLRYQLYKKTLDLPLSYFSNERKGDLMSRMTTDVMEIEWSVIQTLEMIFREPLTIIVILSMMVMISVKLTVIFLVIIPLPAVLIAMLGRRIRKQSLKSKGTLGQLISTMEETLGGLKIIKGFTGERYMRSSFQNHNQQFYKESVALYRKNDLTSPLSEIVVTAILMLILYYGGTLVFAGELSGALFITFFGLASQLIPPIKQISTAYNSYQKGLASQERIDKILNARIEPTDTENAQVFSAFKNQIEFKNLSFKYPERDLNVLHHIQLVIPKGQMLALVGASGSGKTTLADLIPKFHRISEGDILIDGISIQQISTASLRRHIAIVSQENILFNDSVLNNIVFGLENVSLDAVKEAAKIACADGFIAELPDGYDTRIGDRGGKLSGGQRQRIAIARAVLRNPDILILDEATSALDTESEAQVQEALNRLMHNRTCIIIAHRLSTIAKAHKIVVIDQGKIIEEGTHASLLQQKGAYHKLVELQGFH